MPTDRREQILSQIMTNLQALIGSGTGQFATVWRDRGSLQQQSMQNGSPILPAAVLMQGDEYPSKKTPSQGHGVRPGPNPPQLMVMCPFVHIVLLPTGNLQNVGQGALLSTYRVATLNAIINSIDIQRLLGADGDISILEITTDMKEGDTMVGLMKISLAITYIFNPLELQS